MNSDFFRANRQRIIEVLGDGILVVSAYDKMQLTNDAAAPFVQESNFWWLTGIEASGWRMAIDCKSGKSFLLEPIISEVERLFDGALSIEAALARSGADSVITEATLVEMLQGKQAYALQPQSSSDASFVLNPSQKRMWNFAEKHANQVSNVRQELARLRAIKSATEIQAIKEAINVTAQAFLNVEHNFSTYVRESDIAADITHTFLKNGSTHAYAPIVASGKNACTLHYAQNSGILSGLVLIDVGAKINGYSADITRTYGTANVSDREKNVHVAVREALEEIKKRMSLGMEIREYLLAVDEVMVSALVNLGLMKNRKDIQSYRKYFPHAISHGLGVDVHDSLGRYDTFREGMVLTIEPGVYIPEEGIGVRIEDDILFTANGVENLSSSIGAML